MSHWDKRLPVPYNKVSPPKTLPILFPLGTNFYPSHIQICLFFFPVFCSGTIWDKTLHPKFRLPKISRSSFLLGQTSIRPIHKSFASQNLPILFPIGTNFYPSHTQKFRLPKSPDPLSYWDKLLTVPYTKKGERKSRELV
jgi:hypothetical protein